jgi:hypothetical protein
MLVRHTQAKCGEAGLSKSGACSSLLPLADAPALAVHRVHPRAHPLVCAGRKAELVARLRDHMSSSQHGSSDDGFFS